MLITLPYRLSSFGVVVQTYGYVLLGCLLYFLNRNVPSYFVDILCILYLTVNVLRIFCIHRILNSVYGYCIILQIICSQCYNTSLYCRYMLITLPYRLSSFGVVVQSYGYIFLGFFCLNSNVILQSILCNVCLYSIFSLCCLCIRSGCYCFLCCLCHCVGIFRCHCRSNVACQKRCYCDCGERARTNFFLVHTFSFLLVLPHH